MEKDNLTAQLRGFMEYHLRHYHETLRQIAEYRRAPENQTAAGERYQLQMTYVTDCIRRVLDRGDGIDRKLVRLIYWDCSKNVIGAGLELGLSKTQAYRRLNRILFEIAQELGYIQIPAAEQDAPEPDSPGTFPPGLFLSPTSYPTDCMEEAEPDAETLEIGVQSYFQSLRAPAPADAPTGKAAREPQPTYLKPPTLPGLCLHLGITREAWDRYCTDREFPARAAVCRRAMLRFEEYLEESLLARERGVSGIVSMLQNRYGWSDRPDAAGKTPDDGGLSGMSLADRMAYVRRLAQELQSGT